MKGGSYTRNPDGSLTLIERTLEPGEITKTPAMPPADTDAVEVRVSEKQKKGANNGA